MKNVIDCSGDQSTSKYRYQNKSTTQLKDHQCQKQIKY